MNCRTARGLFSLCLDGGLTFGEERQLNQHLDLCSACATEYRGLERTVGWVRDLPEIPPAATFVQDVMVAVRRRRDAASPAPAPGLGERIRLFFAGLVLAPSPRFAAAALVLGLAVGVGGARLAFHSPASPPTAGQPTGIESMRAETDTAPEELSTAPLPSGPFEELVQEMLKRVESGESGADEAVSAPSELDWGTVPDFDAQGRQVGTGTRSEGNRDRNARVTIVF